MGEDLALALAAQLEPLAGALAPPPVAGETVAAVLVVLLPGLTPAPGFAPLRLLLTVRPTDLRTHAGEVSFPGGRRDSQDRDLLATALRECAEEVGLGREAFTVLGALPLARTLATNYIVQPFVVLAKEANPTLVAAQREVLEILTPTLGSLPGRRVTVALERRGIRFKTDAFRLERHLVWGLTYRVISDLLARLSLL